MQSTSAKSAANASAETNSLAELQRHSFVFTGNGHEYFRIWIVNLALSLFTLGIYTAWAKTRRLQYFYRNTQLANAVFDFHGDPLRIFLGRLLAVSLFLLYNHAFDISLHVGVAVVMVLFIGLPYFIRGSLRFRLRNCSYRGLRLDFTGSILGAYFAYWPMLLLFLLPTIWLGVGLGEVWMAWFGLLYLLWPWMHGWMRAYQHRHLRYGHLQSEYQLSAWRFYKLYFSGIAWGLFALFAVAISLALLLGTQPKVDQYSQTQLLLGLITALILIYVVYLFSTPFVTAKIFNLCWNHTRFPEVTIRSEMPLGGYLLLVIKNTLLTILTIGLYRPYALVALWRYRLQHMSMEMPADFWHSQVAHSRQHGHEQNSGEGVADLLNIDLSW